MSSASCSRLALGTAQFGLDYGIANVAGQVTQSEIDAILHRASASGIDTLDTAAAYGDSESRLGAAGVAGWRVVTKLPPVRDTTRPVADWVTQSVHASLEHLGCERITGLLLHRAEQLLASDGDALYGAMCALRDAGLVEKIGVSVYGPAELDALWPRYRFDLVQAPFSVVDRRLVASGWLQRLADAGVEVHARSAFLQGLLLMPPEERPARFSRWDSLWDAWDAWLAGERVPALRAALGFVLAHEEIGRVVVGVDRASHLREIVDAAAASAPTPPASIATDDVMLVNPSNWSTL